MDKKNQKNETVTASVVGELKPLRKVIRRAEPLTTFWTGTCKDTTTCCIT